MEGKNRSHRAAGGVDLRNCEQSLSGQGSGQCARIKTPPWRQKSSGSRFVGQTLSGAEGDGRDRKRERKLFAAGIDDRQIRHENVPNTPTEKFSIQGYLLPPLAPPDTCSWTESRIMARLI